MFDTIEDSERIDKLYYSVEHLKLMHENVSVIEHSLIENKGKSVITPYEPTFFLYVYFTFNTIYSIDWANSLLSGEIEYYKKSIPDNKKINKLIDICFNTGDDSRRFISSFFPVFEKIMTMNYSKEEINQAMELIVVDDVNVTEQDKKKAIVSFKKILTKDGFEAQVLKDISSYIHNVRCNIVHGRKSMNHMKDQKQKERISIYSYFYIAIQHMLFMFLNYLRNGEYLTISEVFVKSLSESH